MITYLNPAEWVHEPLMATWPAPVLWRFAFPLKINVFSLPFDRPFFGGDSHFHQETTFSEKFTFSHFSHVRYLFFVFSLFKQMYWEKERNKKITLITIHYRNLWRFQVFSTGSKCMLMESLALVILAGDWQTLRWPFEVDSISHRSVSQGQKLKFFGLSFFFLHRGSLWKETVCLLSCWGAKKKSWKSLTRENTTEAKFS